MGASTNAGNQPRPYACFNFLLSMHPTKTKTKTINENENPKTKTVLVARSRWAASRHAFGVGDRRPFVIVVLRCRF
jgi:hypothetical protein